MVLKVITANINAHPVKTMPEPIVEVYRSIDYENDRFDYSFAFCHDIHFIHTEE